MEDDNPFKALDHVSQTYVALHDAMMKMYHDKNTDGFLSLAEKLLTKADLPYLIRARCHTMLALRLNSDFSVEHGETAVALFDNEVRNIVVPEQFPQELFDEAKRVLEAAKANEAKRAEKKKNMSESLDAKLKDAAEQLHTTTTSTTKSHGGLKTPGPSRQTTGGSQNPPSRPGGRRKATAGLPTPSKDRQMDPGDQTNDETEEDAGTEGQ